MKKLFCIYIKIFCARRWLLCLYLSFSPPFCCRRCCCYCCCFFLLIAFNDDHFTRTYYLILAIRDVTSQQTGGGVYYNQRTREFKKNQLLPTDWDRFFFKCACMFWVRINSVFTVLLFICRLCFELVNLWFQK